MLFLTYLVYYYRFRSVEATGFLTFSFSVAPSTALALSGATGSLIFHFSVAPAASFVPSGATVFLTFLFPVAPSPSLAPSGATGFLTFLFSVAHQSVLPVGATIILFYKKEYFYQTAYINIFSDGFASALLI